jgi:SAM-dependent methyltransferase
MGTAETQGRLWGAKAQDWAELQEPAWRRLYAQVLARAGARQGTRLLDVGCGAGGALAVAAAMGAQVTGLDASAALVEIARARLQGARIEVGEIEALPFASGAFDLVTGFNAYQFAGKVIGALAESRRVCRPGGSVVMLVWGAPQHCDILARIVPAITALLPPPELRRPSPTPLATPGVMEGLMRAAGLAPSAAEEIESVFAYADLDTAMRAMAAAAPAIRAERHAGADALRAALQMALRPFLDADGSVRLRNRFRYAIATRTSGP